MQQEHAIKYKNIRIFCDLNDKLPNEEEISLTINFTSFIYETYIINIYCETNSLKVRQFDIAFPFLYQDNENIHFI